MWEPLGPPLHGAGATLDFSLTQTNTIPFSASATSVGFLSLANKTVLNGPTIIFHT